MSEVPDDIMKTARELRSKLRGSCTEAHELALICEALEAERQRCAEVAMEWSQGALAEAIMKGTTP